jgi:hypothetical protein
MSKKKTIKPEAENPEVENPQVEQPETEQPETEQPETEQPEVEHPETEQSEVETPINTQPDYVKDLMEKGVAVLQGRSRGELDEMLAAIPADIPYYAGAVGYYVDKGIYRIQVNRKEE